MSSSVLWYSTRSTAIVAFVLMTATTALGVLSTRRGLASVRWPRFATQTLHRNLSLLAMVFLLAHITTTMLDSYVDVGWLSTVLPLSSAYRRPWVALGTAAFDILLVVIISSLLRTRVPARMWRALHWSAYAIWPLALVHFLETGTDAARHRFGLWIALTSMLVMAAAVLARLLGDRVAPGRPPIVADRALVGAR